MYLTHSFVAIEKGSLDYLFFYLTEDYIEDQVRLQEQLQPLLQEFGRNLFDKGAIVQAFSKEVTNTKKEVVDKWKQQEDLHDVVFFSNEKHTPGLLIIDKDFSEFNPHKNQWLYVSFRDYIDDFGQVKIFDLKQLLDTFVEICNNGKNIFEEAKEYIRKQEAVNAHKVIEIKPGIFGISFDIKEAVNFIRNWRSKYKQA